MDVNSGVVNIRTQVPYKLWNEEITTKGQTIHAQSKVKKRLL